MSQEPPAESTTAPDRQRRDVPVGVVMVGMSAIAWWPAFTLGAWGEIFFDNILGLWAASTAAFVFVLVERRPVRGRLVRAFVLLIPTVWLVLNFLVSSQDPDDLGAAIVDLFALLVVIVGIPFTLWVLVRIIWPEFAAERRRRTIWLITSVVLGVAVISLLLGMNQSRFLTCQDFAISGNSEPPGCTPEETSTPTPTTPAPNGSPTP